MVRGHLRDRRGRPYALPRHRLPVIADTLALILPRVLLLLAVRHIERRSSEAGDRVHQARGRPLPSNLEAAAERSAVVVQVAGMDRIEKTRRGFTPGANRQREPPAERPADHARDLAYGFASGCRIDGSRPGFRR